jgi:hypothetical protein
MPAYTICHRARPCLKRIQPMPNVPPAYVSVYRRISDIFHTLAYASTIRYSVIGPLPPRNTEFATVFNILYAFVFHYF